MQSHDLSQAQEQMLIMMQHCFIDSKIMYLHTKCKTRDEALQYKNKHYHYAEGKFFHYVLKSEQ